MRVITAFIVALIGAVAVAEAAAQPTARRMYTTLQSREQTTRRALDASKPERVVRRDVERVVAGYEGLVARFPRNGYADNALWQAAFLAADSFARYRVEVDRLTSVRLLRRLTKEYPASPLIKRVDPALKRGRPHLVAYLGVMAPQDGVDHLLRAAHHLVRTRGRTDISFTLMGAGDSFEDLKRLATTLELDDVVAFTGRIPDPEVEAVLATADVCVSPDPLNPLNDISTMNKVLEYMACGRPIVAFDLREHRASAGDGALYAEPNRDDDLGDRVVLRPV